MSMYQCKGCDAQSWNEFTDGLCDACWEKKHAKLKVGDKVMYKDGDMEVYTVLDVCGDKVSLSLAEYEDIEQDFYTNIDEIEKV